VASVTAPANAMAGSYAVIAMLADQQATFALTNTAGAAATVTATGGTPQSTVVGQAFANPLAVHVADASGNTIAGATVVFATPSNGASASLSATTVTTDANGNASVTAAANAIAGSYQVTAAVSGVATNAVFALTNTLDAAEIIFESGFDSN
jgi:hypothetical protein